MEALTFTQEFTSTVQAGRLFKALILDAPNLIPKLMPEAIKNVQLVEGNGGPGSIQEITIAEGDKIKHLKHRVDAIDLENLTYSYAVIEGDGALEKVESISHEIKFEAIEEGGCKTKNVSKYLPKAGVEIKEEDFKAAKEEGDDDNGNDNDDGCLDDWEAMADALAADDKRENPCPDSPPVVSPCDGTNLGNLGSPNSKPGSGRTVPWGSGNSRAWRADDAFRPQSLPNLSKQHSMPNPDRRCVGGVPWGRVPTPSSCPICCEDLDLTDSSFMPCLCGFRLCLFCHKRILEEDGRCPGCRKPYECEPVETEASVLGGSLTLRLARSCSMIERP